MRGGRWCRCNDVTISHDKVKSHEWQQRLCWQTRGCSGSSANERHAANGWAFVADRRHPRTAMARVVNTTATRVTKKARGSRATWVRVARVIMETSPREEGEDGHNNQLGTKVAATARTVVATTARAITPAARATATGVK